jgi:hypothetical protein
MVVSYKSFSETAPLVVGTYVASEEVDVPLKKSEPPNHDRWDTDSANLRDEQGTERELVKAVLSRIKAGLKRFQAEAAPPAPPKQRRLTILERALGSYFKPQSMGPPPQPEVETSALHLEFTKPPYPEPTRDGMLRLKSAFTVTLDQAADDDEVDLRLRVRCPVLEDDNEEGDELPVSVYVKGVSAQVDSDNPQIFRFSLGKGEKARFTIQSQAYDPAWTVRLRPEIEEETAP